MNDVEDRLELIAKKYSNHSLNRIKECLTEHRLETIKILEKNNETVLNKVDEKFENTFLLLGINIKDKNAIVKEQSRRSVLIKIADITNSIVTKAIVTFIAISAATIFGINWFKKVSTGE